MFLIFAWKLESTIFGEYKAERIKKMYYLSKFLDLLINYPMFIGINVNMHINFP